MDLFLFPSEGIGHAGGDKIQGTQHQAYRGLAGTFLSVSRCEFHHL